MKPTQDIIEELRDAVEQTTDQRYARLLTDAADRIEHLFASGIHTCHADCQRPLCVLRRERDKAQADLARVTAERDSQRADIERLVWNLGGCDTIASGWGKPGDYNEEMALPALDSVSRMASERDALRARVAELDESLHLANGTADLALHHRDIAEQRNADLAAALLKCHAFLNEWRDCLAGVQMTEADFDNTSGLLEAHSAIASAESATPAKHPDTDIVDWVEANHRTVMAFEDGSFSCWSVDGHEFRGTTAREVIDAARKQEASK